MTKTPLAVVRNQLGWTQTRLADAVGCGVSTISELEKEPSPNPSYRLVASIVRVLAAAGVEITADQLFPSLHASDRRGGERSPEVA